MAFPDPNNNQTHQIGDKTWNYDGEKWVLIKIDEAFTFEKEEPITVVRQSNTVTYGIDHSVLDELTN